MTIDVVDIKTLYLQNVEKPICTGEVVTNHSQKSKFKITIYIRVP